MWRAFPGALACLLGISLPSLIVLTVVTWCYTQVKDNLYVSQAMTGVRAAIAPVVASAALKLRKAALTDRAGYVFLLLAFVLYLFGGLSCILIVLISGFLGWLLSVWHCRKGRPLMILLELFWSFCKIGFTSFGGLSMVPLINSEMLSHGWMTLSEVSDIVAIAEMTPGPLGLNCATFAGTRVAGLAGAVSASLGSCPHPADLRGCSRHV